MYFINKYQTVGGQKEKLKWREEGSNMGKLGLWCTSLNPALTSSSFPPTSLVTRRIYGLSTLGGVLHGLLWFSDQKQNGGYWHHRRYMNCLELSFRFLPEELYEVVSALPSEKEKEGKRQQASKQARSWYLCIPWEMKVGVAITITI